MPWDIIIIGAVCFVVGMAAEDSRTEKAREKRARQHEQLRKAALRLLNVTDPSSPPSFAAAVESARRWVEQELSEAL